MGLHHARWRVQHRPYGVAHTAQCQHVFTPMLSAYRCQLTGIVGNLSIGTVHNEQAVLSEATDLLSMLS